MARHSKSGKKTKRVADVLSDHGSNLGRLLKRGSLLMQLQHLLSGLLDPSLENRFQVANVRDRTLVLVTPAAAWAALLRLQSHEMIRALREAGYPNIDRVEIRVAPLVEKPVAQRRERPLSPAARRALDTMARIGSDKED